MYDKDKLVQFNVRIPFEMKKDLKLIALQNDMSVQDVMNKILAENIERYK